MPQSFTEFMCETSYDDIPEPVREVMRRSLLDTIGVAALGSTTEIARITRRYADTFWNAPSDKPRARMIMNGGLVSPAGAAFAGAFTLDSIDAHDGFSPAKGHAGSAVFPALLALVEERRFSGKPMNAQDFMLAMVQAYEIGGRSGLAMHGTVSDYHTSGAWNAVGIAAATGRALGLDAGGIRHAVGIAEYHGPRSQMMRCIDFPTMLRDGVGWGAPTGLSAAYMAEMGFTGAPAITIEAENAAAWWDDLGDDWRIYETHYKRYPVCRWAHPALDAIELMMRDHGLTHHDIEKIRIQTFHNATRLAGVAPKTLDELTYAIVYPAAIMAVRGKIGRAELREEVLHDPDIQRVAQAMELVETAHYTKISHGKRWADVTLYLSDGREIMSAPMTPRGDADDPLSEAELAAKFDLLSDGLIPPERGQEMKQAAREFDRLSDADFTHLLDNIFQATQPDQAG